MANFLNQFDKKVVVRALFFFVLIIILFFCIEIVPLHFGSQKIPWESMGPEVSKRLPRILLIGIGASLLLALKAKDKVQ